MNSALRSFRWKKPHPPRRDLVHRAHQLHVALGLAGLRFGGVPDLAHRPADIGFHAALQFLVGREPGLDARKAGDDVVEQASDARGLLQPAMDRVEAAATAPQPP